MMQEKYNHVLHQRAFPYSLNTESANFHSYPNSNKTNVLHVDFEDRTVNFIIEKNTNVVYEIILPVRRTPHKQNHNR